MFCRKKSPTLFTLVGQIAVVFGIRTSVTMHPQRDPVVQLSAVLARGQVISWAASAREKPVTPTHLAEPEPWHERFPCRFRQFERHGSAGLLLKIVVRSWDRVA